MKIAGSTIAMASERRESSYTSADYLTIETRDGQSVIEGIKRIAEEEGKSLSESYKQFEKEEKASKEKERQQNQAKAMLEYLDRMRQSSIDNQFKINEDPDRQIMLLRRLLSALNGKKLDPVELEQAKKTGVLDLRSSNMKKAEMIAGIRGQSGSDGASGKVVQAGEGIQIGTNTFSTTWHKITVASGFHAESEFTTFASTGLATTEDGRSISFGIEVSMSRSFMVKIDSYTDETYIKTDPLMINLDTNVGSVSDVKFKFDLDGDGWREDISFAGKGSGFIALDKNGNGKIDDGNELFGTKSGDGFADLAAYDEDGNGWIDENDSVYSNLRVWIKDDEGNDKLLNLKEADVGAIYLGNVSTEFSLKDEENHTNGIIRKTGVYLKESGGAGTVNHVDLTL